MSRHHPPDPFELPRPQAPGLAAGPLPYAFVGPDGSHTARALRRHLGLPESAPLSRETALACDGAAAAVAAVVAGRARRAVVPWRNALGGGVFETIDAVVRGCVWVEDAWTLPVRQALAVRPGTRLEAVRVVASHPEALRQCDGLVRRLSARVLPQASTAAAARSLAGGALPGDCAVLCDPDAARRLGLCVLVDDASDAGANRTVFVLVRAKAQPEIVSSKQYEMGFLCLRCEDRPGILARALACLSGAGIDLGAIESRPAWTRPFEVAFVADLRACRGAAVLRAQAALRACDVACTWLGGARAPEGLDEEAVPTGGGGLPHAAARGSVELQQVASGEDGGRHPSAPGAAPDGGGASAPLRPAEGATEPAFPPVASPRRAPGGGPVPPSDGRKRWVDLVRGAARTVVEVGRRPVRIGDGGFVLIAGPCSVETPEQTEACAREVAAAGGHVLRGGAFKPRTSPYAFQGLGEAGLAILAEAGRRAGLPIVTEVLEPARVALCARHADMLQVGARNMQNFPLLAALGEVDRPVLLKRGMSATLEELLHAAEYILSRGNPRVVLCERGIRTFETATRATLDLSAVAVLKTRTHLPVIVDPSHAAGDRRYVPALARAAKAVGADGILVEIHPNPKKALSDGPQALTFDMWRALAAELRGGGPQGDGAKGGATSHGGLGAQPGRDAGAGPT